MAERKVGPRSGLVKTTVYVRPDQLQRLHAEARRRAEAAGQLRPDASAVLREALDAWSAATPPPPRGPRRR